MNPVKILLILISSAVLCLLVAQESAESFFEQQQQYPRVRAALREKGTVIQALLESREIDISHFRLYLRAFKADGLLEVWARNNGDTQYQLLTTYDICSPSGTLGPKRRSGDLQVPEGFYHIEIFNPFSNFHLSLGTNYPNQSDRIRGDRNNLGSDIYIHGACVTIGCIPITDDKIKELYLMCVYAKSNGQSRIPVHIFPSHLDESGLEKLQEREQTTTELMAFWENLKPMYTHFEAEKKILKHRVNQTTGQYVY